MNGSSTFRTWPPGLSEGELSFDKVRAVVDTATPETDRELRQRARQCSVHQLAQLGRNLKGASDAKAKSDYEMRSVRFNDTFRTVTAQLPPESYAEVRSTLEAGARQMPSDGETRWDQRLCDAFLETVRTPSTRTPARTSWWPMFPWPRSSMRPQNWPVSSSATG